MRGAGVEHSLVRGTSGPHSARISSSPSSAASRASGEFQACPACQQAIASAAVPVSACSQPAGVRPVPGPGAFTRAALPALTADWRAVAARVLEQPGGNQARRERADGGAGATPPSAPDSSVSVGTGLA
jgi:hypothetical protein